MYAQLCKRLSIEAPNFETNNESCCTFLRLLVNNCRDKFENRAVHFENIINSSSVLTDDDEEKRNIAKAKMLGNVKFIGEIFKLGMLGETHLHKMLRSLLQKGSRQNPTLEERCDDLECLAQILKTCGKQLDASPGKNLMDQYFEHVERKIQTNSYYPPRIRFLLRDVIELRNNNWIPRKIARTDGPVPMQDLNTDEDILRGGSAAYLHRQQRDQRNNERDSNHWMSKLPLNLQSTGFNDMFSSLSVTGGTSSLIPPFSPQQNSYGNRNDMRENSRHGGHDSHRGGHRSYNNNNNQRNHHHHQDGNNGGGHNNNYNPRYNKHNQHGGGGSGGGSSSGGHQNQNNSHNNSYHHQNNQQQNNMLNNKDIAPRFKRTMMTPTTQTNTVDNLEMRPNQNSLLYKASQSMKQQQPLPLQPPTSNSQSQNNSPYGGRNSNPEQTRGNGGHQTSNGHYNNQHQQQYGQNRNSNWNANYNNQHNSNNKGSHGGPLQHSSNDNNFQSSPFGNATSLGSNTLLGQTKNAVGKPMAVVAPTASTPINNIMQKDQIPIKQAPEKTGKKEKKDKGPGKEEFMKLVYAFVNETLLKKDESNESKLIEENGDTIAQEENGIEEKAAELKDDDVKNEDDNDQELKKKSSGNSMEDKVAAFLELKVPDKFMKDAVIRILNEILDKDDGVHDRIIEFLLTMRKETKLTNSALLEAFKNVINTMNEKEKTIPKITTIIASLLSRAVMVKLCKLSDIANYAENGQHYPLFLLVLQQLHKKMGKQPLQEMFNTSKVNLMLSLPEVDRTKDRMAEILDDRSLSFLYPLLRVQTELWKQITTDPNPQAFYKYIKENIESSLYTDPGFITAMTTVVVKYITKESSLAEGVDLTKLADKAIVDKEKQLLEKYSPVLISFLHQKIDLQLIAIYALQVFCYSVNFPKGMLLRWFTALYELNIIDEDAFLRWKEDITDMYPGKGQALFQVNAYLTYLAEAESEEDEEDEA